jgi:hypothetical protein
MMQNEYIRIEFDPNDLGQLNRLGTDGWRPVMNLGTYLLLERRFDVRDVQPVPVVQPVTSSRGRLLEQGSPRHGLA